MTFCPKMRRPVTRQGVGLRVLWPQMLAMAVIGATVLSVSVSRFRKSLD
jgi:ABC-2 type transport system permease protein